MRRNIPLRAAFAVLALAGFVMLSGCTDLNQPPLAPEQEAAISAASQTLARTSKPTKKGNTAVSSTTATSTEPTGTGTRQYKSVTKYVSTWDEALWVKFQKYGTENDITVKDANLYIEPNSVVDGAGYDITMEVYSGTTLGDVEVIFSPSGVQFEPKATLTLHLLGPVTPADVTVMEHISGIADVELIATETDRKGNSYLIVKIKVPGFSRYSLGGDDFWNYGEEDDYWY